MTPPCHPERSAAGVQSKGAQSKGAVSNGEPNVLICDLGSWGAASLVAEYDPCDDTIRVNARAVERVRAALGGAHADRFVACAVAHERYHRMHPACSEADAHAFARATCGEDPETYERVLRGPHRADDARAEVARERKAVSR